MANHKGIYKRGNIYWIRYAGLDGKTCYESTGGTQFKAAQELLRLRRNDVVEGNAPDVKRIISYTFRELAEKYSEWMEVRHKSAANKKYLIAKMVTKFGNLPLRRLSPSLLKEYQTELMKLGQKNCSVNKKILLFRAMIKWATEEKMVEKNILLELKTVKLEKDDSVRTRFITVEECKTLVDACASYFRPIVVMALMTGMRKREILNLRWDRVDLEHGFILLKGQDTKTEVGRNIPMAPELKQILESLTCHEDCPFVFPNVKTLKPFFSGEKPFANAVAKAGIKDFRFHDLRHTYASHLVMSGVDLTTVMHLLGHSSLKMTLRYSHLAPSHTEKALSALGERFQGVFGSQDTNGG